MATLTARSLYPNRQPVHRPGQEPGSWGLLLIPVSVCISMIIFALDAKAPPPPDELPVSRSCASPNQPRPPGVC